MQDSPLNATVIYRQDLDAERAIVRVRPDSGVAPAFVAGQFVMLGPPAPAVVDAIMEREEFEAEISVADSPLPPEPTPVRPIKRPGRVRMIKRAYSIASPPTEREFLEFFV